MVVEKVTVIFSSHPDTQGPHIYVTVLLPVVDLFNPEKNVRRIYVRVCVFFSSLYVHVYVPILQPPFTFLMTGCGEPFSDFSNSSVCCSPFSASRVRRCFLVRSFWKNNRI